MLVERIWAANSARNFHYLVACEASGEALAIDPLNWEAVLERARSRGWRITQILNTHEHWDHIGGNEPLRAATGATLLAHAGAVGKIGNVNQALGDGDLIRVGSTVALHCLDTPGHTRAHLCAFAAGARPMLFCGDTLFNAGAGNCVHGGDPGLLFETFTTRLAPLPPATCLYPGHEYLARNLGFTLAIEPSNTAAAALLQQCAHRSPEETPVTTLAQEREINVFFRLDAPQVRATLAQSKQPLPPHADTRGVFLALRELRNHW